MLILGDACRRTAGATLGDGCQWALGRWPFDRMTLTIDWTAQGTGATGDIVKAAIPISGIFDLNPSAIPR